MNQNINVVGGTVTYSANGGNLHISNNNGVLTINGEIIDIEKGINNVEIYVSGDVRELTTGSGDVSVQGTAGHVRTGSGDVVAQSGVSGSLQTGSGDIFVQGDVAGSVRTGSGKIRYNKPKGV